MIQILLRVGLLGVAFGCIAEIYNQVFPDTLDFSAVILDPPALDPVTLRAGLVAIGAGLGLYLRKWLGIPSIADLVGQPAPEPDGGIEVSGGESARSPGAPARRFTRRPVAGAGDVADPAPAADVAGGRPE